MKSEQFVKHTYVVPQMEAIAMAPHSILCDSPTPITGENITMGDEISD